jgi:hypothetical protein
MIIYRIEFQGFQILRSNAERDISLHIYGSSLSCSCPHTTSPSKLIFLIKRVPPFTVRTCRLVGKRGMGRGERDCWGV